MSVRPGDDKPDTDMPTAAPKTVPWPTRLTVAADRRRLTVDFDTGEKAILAAADLRRDSPSAEMRGHRTGGGAGDRPAPDVDPDVTISDLEPIGRYAVRIIFSDGHATGLYSWARLYRFGEQAATLSAG